MTTLLALLGLAIVAIGVGGMAIRILWGVFGKQKWDTYRQEIMDAQYSN